MAGHEYLESIPHYMKDFPCCLPAIQVSEDMMAKTVKMADMMNTESNAVELEVRFGSCVSSASGRHQFKTGVSETEFDMTRKRLDSCRDFVESYNDTPLDTSVGSESMAACDADGWYTTYVYMHKDKTNERTVRTETIMPPLSSSSQGHGPPLSVSHVQKQSVEKTNFITVMLTKDKVAQQSDIRMALTLEKKVNSEEIDKFVEPLSVHIKKRKDYTLCSSNSDKPMWRYSLTQRWMGKNLEEAEKDYLNCPPIYEIELELVCPSLIHQMGTGYMAHSLLMKVSDLLGVMHSALSNRKSYILEPQTKPGRRI